MGKKTRVEQRSLSRVILFKVLVAKDQKIFFSVGEGWGNREGLVAVGYVTLVTPDAPVIDGWQGLQLSPRHPAVNYCPSARHPHISSSPYLLLYSGYGTSALCAGEDCASTCVILQSDLCLSKPRMFNSCNVLACNYGNDCLFKMYICSRNKKWAAPSGDGRLAVAKITLTLLYTLHCDEFCTECLCRGNSERIFFFTFEAAKVLILKLCTFLSPSYLMLPRLDLVAHN